MNKTAVLFVSLFYISVGQKEVILTINDKDTLEYNIRNTGLREDVAEIIYDAANCNLKRNHELDRKLDKLISPVERLQQQFNEVLNKISHRSSGISEAKPTLELLVKHRWYQQPVAGNNQMELGANSAHKVHPAITDSDDTEFLPFEFKQSTVDVEECKSYTLLAKMAGRNRQRRADLLEIAAELYNYDGDSTISSLAGFYSEYVRIHYNQKRDVMGLAKLLGDYASVSSEIFFSESLVNVEGKKCAINLLDYRVQKRDVSVRTKRNVQISSIKAGVCSKSNWEISQFFSNVTLLKDVPYAKYIQKLNLPSCGDQGSVFKTAQETESFRSIVVARYTNGTNACVDSSYCQPGLASIGSNSCGGKDEKGEFTNIDSYQISVFRGRMNLDEIPEELLKFEKPYCSIQGIVTSSDKECKKPVRSREKFTLYHINSQWLVTDRDVLVAHGQDSSDLCFYTCSPKCIDCSKCKGDETYESTFGRWPDANCKCTFCHDCSDLYMQIGDSRLAVNAIISVTWDVTVPVESEKVVKCSGCKASCKGRQVKIERDTKFDIIHLCVHENCKEITSDKTDFVYELPGSVLHVTKFSVMFYRSDGVGQAEVDVICLDPHTCQAIHCDVCLERFGNPHCYKFINWVILVASISALILIAPLCCLIYKVSKIILFVILAPVRFLSKLIRALCKKCARNSKVVMGKTGKRINKFVEDDDTPVRSNRSNSLLVSIAILGIICSVPSCLSCENVASVDNKVMDCLPSASGSVKCSINTVVEIPLSAIGEESCLNLNDQSGNLVQIIKIKTTSIKQKCAKVVQYYTSDPEFKLVNEFRCRNAGQCVDDICEKTSSDGPVPVGSADDSKAGFYGCNRVTGFWGKGCFYSSLACQFYKVELQNRFRVAYEVSKCLEWFWEIKVNSTIMSKDGHIDEVITLDSPLPIKARIGSVQLISLNVPSVTLTDKCLLRRLTGLMRTALVDCSERNNPIIGKVGGIQCATPTLAEISSRSCLVDKNTIQIITQDDNVAFVNRFKNVTEEWQQNLLPRNLTNSVITEDGSGQVYLHFLGFSLYNVRIKMDDYKISYTVVKPSCEAHFRRLMGCSSCGTGALLSVEIVIINAIRAPVSISCPSSSSLGLELALSSMPLTIFKMSFTKSEIDEQCTVKCPGNEVNIDVKGTLIGKVSIRKQNETTILTQGSDFFSSIPWSSFGVLRYFYLAVGLFTLIPILYVGFLLIVWVLKALTRVTFKKSKRMRKNV